MAIDDIEYFEAWPFTPVAVRGRVIVERAIVREFVWQALAEGYLLRLHDGERWSTRTTGDYMDIMRSLMGGADEERLHVYAPGATAWTAPRWIGAVQLVYGGDGYDVIAECTDAQELDGILARAMQLAERLEDQGAAVCL